nr:hypothetical protein [Verrucomicrobiota bacterium]
MRFPVTIRHRSAQAKIYAPGKKFPHYRIAYPVAGKRQMRTFPTYTAARKAAKRIVRDLAKGSQATALTAKQSRDALAALQQLENFHQSTGRHVSLLAAVSEFAEVAKKLHGHTLNQAVTGYLRTEVNIGRKDIKQAVQEFLDSSTPLTCAAEGQRAQL